MAIKIATPKLGVVVNTFNPNTWEAETCGFKDSPVYKGSTSTARTHRETLSPREGEGGTEKRGGGGRDRGRQLF